MKKSLITFILVITFIDLFAQRESFDVFKFSAPEAGSEIRTALISTTRK
ncbi:MAG: hypothetical protein JST14_16090 [Bacteroidetes bacterium]|nr:hypothetical protein [Bacteroidota bacterium]